MPPTPHIEVLNRTLVAKLVPRPLVQVVEAQESATLQDPTGAKRESPLIPEAPQVVRSLHLAVSYVNSRCVRSNSEEIGHEGFAPTRGPKIDAGARRYGDRMETLEAALRKTVPNLVELNAARCQPPGVGEVMLDGDPVRLLAARPRDDQQYGCVPLHPIRQFALAAKVFEGAVRLALKTALRSPALNEEHSAQSVASPWFAQFDASIDANVDRSRIPDGAHAQNDAFDEIDALLPD